MSATLCPVGIARTFPTRHPQGRAGNVTLLENAVAAVERLEQAFMAVHGFGTAEQQDAIRHERIVERGNDNALQFRIEIDQQVSARQEVDAGERRIARQAVCREGAKLPDRFCDRAAAIDARDEVARQPLGGHALQQCGWISSGARRRDRGLVNIGRENLHLGRIAVEAIELFAHQNRE